LKWGNLAAQAGWSSSWGTARKPRCHGAGVRGNQTSGGQSLILPVVWVLT
jgi:hypothetical protein